MSETKVFNVPDGNNSIDPALMMALSQNGGFGNGSVDLVMALELDSQLTS